MHDITQRQILLAITLFFSVVIAMFTLSKLYAEPDVRLDQAPPNDMPINE